MQPRQFLCIVFVCTRRSIETESRPQACQEPYVTGTRPNFAHGLNADKVPSSPFQESAIFKACIVDYQLASPLRGACKTPFQLSSKPGRFLPFRLCFRSRFCVVFLDLSYRLVSVVFHHSLLFEVFDLSHPLSVSISSLRILPPNCLRCGVDSPNSSHSPAHNPQSPADTLSWPSRLP